MDSFFSKDYQTPKWLERKLSRRNLLKSAAGAGAVAAMPLSLAVTANDLATITKNDPWLTMDEVLEHLLPSSGSGPGAKEIRALAYVYGLVEEQPIEQEEKEFILKGVGWLNGYSQSQRQQNFVELAFDDKEKMLRAIANSQAGENWLNTLINYIYEAMLSPPEYGGNPNGIGWQWLEHQAGFPLPSKGKRYYELDTYHRISAKNVSTEDKTKS